MMIVEILQKLSEIFTKFYIHDENTLEEKRKRHQRLVKNIDKSVKFYAFDYGWEKMDELY